MLRGTIATTNETTVVLDVHGVGYLLHVVARANAFLIGSEALFHTYLAVRENALDLYGFTDLDQLQIFELLIELPKIGPKSAIQILRQADVALLRRAVNQNDATYLSKMSGIGKKSAEKIVVGLKEKLGDMIDSEGSREDAPLPERTYAHDTIDALITLGYQQDEARRVVRQIAEHHPEIATSPEALKLALQKLSE